MQRATAKLYLGFAVFLRKGETIVCKKIQRADQARGHPRSQSLWQTRDRRIRENEADNRSSPSSVVPRRYSENNPQQALGYCREEPIGKIGRQSAAGGTKFLFFCVGASKKKRRPLCRKRGGLKVFPAQAQYEKTLLLCRKPEAMVHRKNHGLHMLPLTHTLELLPRESTT